MAEKGIIQDGNIISTSSLFKINIKIGRLVSLYVPAYSEHERCRFLTRLFCWMYFVMINVIIWIVPLRLVFIMKSEQESSRILPLLAVFTFHVGAGYTSTATYLTSGKSLKLLCKRLDGHQLKYGPFKRNRCIRKFLFAFTIIGFGISLADAGIYSLLIPEIVDQDKQSMYSPLNLTDDTDGEYALTLAFLFFNELLVLLHMYSMMGMIIAFTFLFVKEFSCLNSNLERLVEDTVNMEGEKLENEIENLRLEHASLIDCMEAANSVVKHYLLGLFATFIPVSCFMLYGMIRNALTNNERLFISFITASNLVTACLFSYIGAKLNLKAHKPLNVLLKINLTKITQKTERSISMFVNRVNGPSIGYNICDLFILDSTAILAMLGTLVTYAVVMLQFTDQSNNHNLVHLNSTYNYTF
ncbi:hypothetical protein LOTGIDRAFT_159430 [Lottia gigantea]|uniref:Gustatory receptor n=1 Tax=Lottia gigantea TaxID=225164 RepID=V4C6X0_LOTGI|nr:hypothetical protein LOTGIDRAFT_159430 [Lottia gigantea]ESO97399.1 hypothetical protein LOTGIDRAFT_159430 [Lottia gigantea]